MRPRKVPEKKESAIEARCREIATEHGCYLLKWVSPGNAGIMDRILIAPRGVVIFMEFKKPGEKLEALQDTWRARFLTLSQRVYRVESVVEFLGICRAHYIW